MSIKKTAGLIRPEDCPTIPQKEKSKDNDRSWAFKEIYDSNEWSSPESKSGKGSEMRYTGESGTQTFSH